MLQPAEMKIYLDCCKSTGDVKKLISIILKLLCCIIKFHIRSLYYPFMQIIILKTTIEATEIASFLY